MRKAQLAVETLLIYGVAILIVMLAIGALIGFGVLDLSSILPDKCDISGVAIKCSDYNVASDGTVQIQLTNALDSNIVIKTLRIYGEDDMEGMWNVSNDPPASSPACEYTGTGTVTTGSKQTYNLQNCIIGIKSGKKIKGTLLLQYHKVGSPDIVRTVYGSINTKVA
ncbi:MAG: hypothetical protein HGA85_02155 [Nanoarchaeota archaeon]|nr:hypothetical protein [Nanoarchaeota archaeon]